MELDGYYQGSEVEGQDDQEDQIGTIQDYQLTRDRERRNIRAPQRLGYAYLIAYALSITDDLSEDEPTTYRDATECDHSDHWIKAMEAEMLSLHINNT